MIYNKKEFEFFRETLILKLKTLREGFYKKVIPDEQELNSLLEACDEDGYCKNHLINSMYRLEKNVEIQMKYIEECGGEFEMGIKNYNKALKKFWEYLIIFNNSVEEYLKIREYKEYKDVMDFIYQTCILGY